MDLSLSRKEPGPPTGPGGKCASEIAKKRYDIQQKNLDMIYTLEDNTTKLYSIFWRQCTYALQQGLRGHEGFHDKDIEFDTKWLLKQIKLTTKGTK